MSKRKCKRCGGTGEVWRTEYTGSGVSVTSTLVPCPKCRGAKK